MCDGKGEEGYINFDLSRSDVENLLAAFLTGAVGVQVGMRLTDLNALPVEHRKHLRAAADAGRTWAAWSTERGPIATWGDYHPEASKGLCAYLILIEWYDTPTGHHSLWCYSYPQRPTEWIVGQSRP